MNSRGAPPSVPLGPELKGSRQPAVLAGLLGEDISFRTPIRLAGGCPEVNGAPVQVLATSLGTIGAGRVQLLAPKGAQHLWCTTAVQLPGSPPPERVLGKDFVESTERARVRDNALAQHTPSADIVFRTQINEREALKEEVWKMFGGEILDEESKKREHRLRKISEEACKQLATIQKIPSREDRHRALGDLLGVEQEPPSKRRKGDIAPTSAPRDTAASGKGGVVPMDIDTSRAQIATTAHDRTANLVEHDKATRALEKFEKEALLAAQGSPTTQNSGSSKAQLGGAGTGKGTDTLPSSPAIAPSPVPSTDASMPAAMGSSGPVAGSSSDPPPGGSAGATLNTDDKGSALFGKSDKTKRKTKRGPGPTPITLPGVAPAFGESWDALTKVATKRTGAGITKEEAETYCTEATLEFLQKQQDGSFEHADTDKAEMAKLEPSGETPDLPENAAVFEPGGGVSIVFIERDETREAALALTMGDPVQINICKALSAATPLLHQQHFRIKPKQHAATAQGTILLIESECQQKSEGGQVRHSYTASKNGQMVTQQKGDVRENVVIQGGELFALATSKGECRNGAVAAAAIAAVSRDIATGTSLGKCPAKARIAALFDKRAKSRAKGEKRHPRYKKYGATDGVPRPPDSTQQLLAYQTFRDAGIQDVPNWRMEMANTAAAMLLAMGNVDPEKDSGYTTAFRRPGSKDYRTGHGPTAKSGADRNTPLGHLNYSWTEESKAAAMVALETLVLTAREYKCLQTMTPRYHAGVRRAAHAAGEVLAAARLTLGTCEPDDLEHYQRMRTPTGDSVADLLLVYLDKFCPGDQQGDQRLLELPGSALGITYHTGAAVSATGTTGASSRSVSPFTAKIGLTEGREIGGAGFPVAKDDPVVPLVFTSAVRGALTTKHVSYPCLSTREIAAYKNAPKSDTRQAVLANRTCPYCGPAATHVMEIASAGVRTPMECPLIAQSSDQLTQLASLCSRMAIQWGRLTPKRTGQALKELQWFTRADEENYVMEGDYPTCEILQDGCRGPPGLMAMARSGTAPEKDFFAPSLHKAAASFQPAVALIAKIIRTVGTGISLEDSEQWLKREAGRMTASTLISTAIKIHPVPEAATDPRAPMVCFPPVEQTRAGTMVRDALILAARNTRSWRERWCLGQQDLEEEASLGQGKESLPK